MKCKKVLSKLTWLVVLSIVLSLYFPDPHNSLGKVNAEADYVYLIDKDIFKEETYEEIDDPIKDKFGKYYYKSFAVPCGALDGTAHYYHGYADKSTPFMVLMICFIIDFCRLALSHPNQAQS